MRFPYFLILVTIVSHNYASKEVADRKKWSDFGKITKTMAVLV